MSVKKILAPVLAVATLGLAIFGGPLGLGAVALFGAKIGVGTLLAVGIGLAGSIFLKPKAPKISPAQQNRLYASLDPQAPRLWVFGGPTALGTDIRYSTYTGEAQDYYHQIMCHASHEVVSVDEIWFDSEKAWSAADGVTEKYTGYLEVTPRTVGTSGNTISIDAGWGSAQRLTGCAYSHIRYKLTGNSKKTDSPFVQAIPSRVTVRGKGAKVPDIRSGGVSASDQSTWVSTEASIRNPALQTLFYLLGWRINGKLAIGRGIPASRIDLDSFITAANLCDEPVTKAAGGTEPRYRADGVFSEADDPSSVLDTLCTSMNAILRDAGGKITLDVIHNDLATPVATFTDDDLLADENWSQTPPINQLFNVTRGRYTDPSDEALYQLVDFPEVTLPGSDYGSLDGIQRIDTFELPLVQSPSQAQRLAKQRLQRNQYQGVYTATLGMRAWQISLGDVVRLTKGTFGWEDKLFRCVGHKMDLSGRVQVTFQEEHPDIYQWDADESPAVQVTAPTVYDPTKWPGFDQGGPLLLANTYAFRFAADGTLDPAGQFIKLDVRNVPPLASVVWRSVDSEAEVPVLKIDQAGTGDVVLNIPVENQVAWLLPEDFGDSLWADIYVEYDGETSNVVRIIRIDPTDALRGDLSNPFGGVLVENDGTPYSWTYADGEIQLFVGSARVRYADGARVYIDSSEGGTATLDAATFEYAATAFDEGSTEARIVFRGEFPGKTPVLLPFTFKAIPRGADGTFDFVSVGARPGAVRFDADGEPSPATGYVGWDGRCYGDLDISTAVWTLKRRNANGTETTIETFGPGPLEPAWLAGDNGDTSQLVSEPNGVQQTRLRMTRTQYKTALGAGTALVAYLTADDPSEDESEQTDWDDMTYVQDGAAGVSWGLNNKAHNVPADANGTVLSYAGANGVFRITRADGTDISNLFTLSTKGGGNPQGLSVSYNNSITPRAFTVGGAGTSSGQFGHSGTDVATLTILATGSAAYSGVTLDEIFSLGKNKQGAAGTLYAELAIFKRSASGAPSTPTGGSFNFSTMTLTPPSGWTAGSAPAGTGAVYESRSAASGAPGSVDSTLTWSSVQQSSGEAGDVGQSVDMIWRRSATQPATPANTTGTPSGWYSDVDAVPASSNPMWHSVRRRTLPTDPWVHEEPIKEEGEDGTDALVVTPSTPAIILQGDASGVPLDGQLPVVVNNTAKRGSTSVAVTDTDILVEQGCDVTTEGTTGVSLDDVSGLNGQFSYNVDVADGGSQTVTIPWSVTVSGAGGGGGGGSTSDSAKINITTAVTWESSSDHGSPSPVTVQSDASGHIAWSYALTYKSANVDGAGTIVTAKLMRSLSGAGSYTDVSGSPSQGTLAETYDANGGEPGAPVILVKGSGGVSASGTLTGLTPNTAYDFIFRDYRLTTGGSTHDASSTTGSATIQKP